MPSGPSRASAHALFAEAEALEADDADAALRAYAAAIATDPTLVDARVNYVRLLHETGRLRDAERACRDALSACGEEPLLHYNLGVVLEDLDRAADAAAAYEAALRLDPDLSDCLYNLALVADRLGRHRDAIRHMARYRRLLESETT